MPEDFLIHHKGQKHNVARFLKFHPGGSNTLKYFKNGDITEQLIKTHHSPSAYELLKDYRVSEENPQEYVREEGDLEHLVDWARPMFWQVGALGPRYREWVLAPVDRKLRLFHSDFIERLTRTPVYLVPSVWVPITLLLLYIGYGRVGHFFTLTRTPYTPLSLLAWCGCYYVCGLLLWPLIEYTIHRWIFHLKPPDHSPLLITLHFGLHGLHHKVPFDDGRLLFPPVPAGILMYLGYSLATGVFMLPLWKAPLVLAGVITGYVTYDLIHFYLHYGSPRPDSYLYNMKRYHNQHHFAHYESGFGISSKFWDHVFGTLIVLRKLSRSLKW